MKKNEVIDRIAEEEAKLPQGDVEGRVWWNKFREFIQAIPEPLTYIDVDEEQIEMDVNSLTYSEDKYNFKKRNKI